MYNWPIGGGEKDTEQTRVTTQRDGATAGLKIETTGKVYTKKNLGAMTPPVDVRSDSCGIFLLMPATSIKRRMTGKDAEMHTTGQGYACSSYKGGVEAVRETFLKSQTSFVSTRGRGWCGHL